MRLLRSTALIMSAAAATTAAGVALAQDGGDEAAKEPSAIVADAARDLAQVKSFHFAGSTTDDDGTTKLSGDVLANGSGRLVLANGKEKARLVALPGKTYIKANAAFWRDAAGKDTSAKVVAKLADRWIREPADASSTALLGDFRPKKLATCLTKGLGTLSKDQPGTTGGQPAIVLKDAGDKPGTAPARYYFTNKAPILLLRIVQTGKNHPGKSKGGSCGGGGDSTTTRGDLAFSQFDKVAKVTAPHGAVTPEQAVGGGGTDAPSTPA
jgi:hypothetical protein